MRKYLILGGTGTLGSAVTEALLKDPRAFITCFSRDELKQKEMAHEFQNNPRLHFVLGDIRNPSALSRAMAGVDTVFHFAALKHIDVAEENPEECVYTNVLGTIYAADEAIRAGVRHFVFSSTDKAVDPLNAYGMCKGVSEKILFRRNETQNVTRFAVYRWGNVVGSRGSFIPKLADALIYHKPVHLTDQRMTRFWIKIEDAVRFMLETYESAEKDKAMIPPIKAASLLQIVDTLARVLKVEDYEVKGIPMRRGEKLHEVLRSQHEGAMSSETFERYDTAELIALLSEAV